MMNKEENWVEALDRFGKGFILVYIERAVSVERTG